MVDGMKQSANVGASSASEALSKAASPGGTRANGGANSAELSAEFQNTLGQIASQMQPQGAIPAIGAMPVAGAVGAGGAISAAGASLGASAALSGNAGLVAPTPRTLGAVGQTLKFSNHAIERMHSRGISIAPEQMRKIEGAVAKAAQKGAKDTLVLSGDNALIVSVKNNTVVTVVDRAAMKDNVFTNIDSTVVV